ncbi:MAG: VOC family protein [Cyclobacteriaceae bacterium]|nr:VOC family protein [Cyclobacteriaceae bacterium]
MKNENSSSSKAVSAIPKGFHTVTPFLVINDAPKVIEFIKKAFDGTEDFKLMTDDNQVMHCSMRIGDSNIMIADAMDSMPEQRAMLFLYVDDVDRVYKKAIAAKGESVRDVRNEFYGDRAGAVKDPSGLTWWIATHVEDVSDEELRKRSKEAEDQMKKAEPMEH